MFSRLLRRRALPVDEMVDGEVALDPGSHNGTASLQGPDPDDDLMIEEVQASDEAGFSGVIELPGDEVELSEVVELPDEVEVPGDE
ncbi:MAG TPA: hypothetical protein VE712_02365, partial [Actinomycetota bacterium]|nr:hypothetical protein [Actinomycetota bacterium]